jgi:hypothetical protein
MNEDTQTHCINHKGRPAVGHCYQCHKPLCEACRYEAAAEGLFCGQACYDHYLAYQARKRPPLRSSRLGSLLIGLLVLAVLAAAALYVGGGKLGLPVLRNAYRAVLKAAGF